MDIFTNLRDESVPQNPKIEITPEISIEHILPVYFDEKPIIAQPYDIWRYDSKGMRYYYRYDSEGNRIWATSNTEMISKTTPTAFGLMQWILSMSKDQYEEYMTLRQIYGKLMHWYFDLFMKNRHFDFSRIYDDLNIIAYETPHPVDRSLWYESIKKNLGSLKQFILDRDVIPIASEISLMGAINGLSIATTIDLIFELTFKRKRVLAILDYKSLDPRKDAPRGFYDEHILQLHIGKMLWVQNFGKTMVPQMMFNWAPVNFRTLPPTYTLKNQTNTEHLAKKISPLAKLFQIEFCWDEETETYLDPTPKDVITSDGILEWETDLSENFAEISANEAITQIEQERLQ